MQGHAHVSDPAAFDTPLLAVGVTRGTTEPAGVLAGLDALLGGAIARVLSGGDLSGRSGEQVVLYHGGQGPDRVVLLGLGEADEVDEETVRRMAGRAVRCAESLRVDQVALHLPEGVSGGETGAARAAAEGASLAAWRFLELKGEDEDRPPTVETVHLFGTGDVAALEESCRSGLVVGEAQNFARTLQARPGNVATPSHLAEEARRMAEETGLEATIFDEEALREAGMHAILAVSRGSREEARLIVLEHRGGEAGDPPLVLVGKGLTFDAGGISLKPPKGMEQMKFDMSGGAAVLGAMKAVAGLDLPLNVVGIVPSSENLPSGSALKPGDVIRTRAGTTVEVINTDAEGRLILADALAYGASLDPAAMVDCATLTGAVVVALGHHAAAVMGTDEALVEELRAAGDTAGERCWPLPLWDVYRTQLDSDTADLKNVGGRPAGSITAGAFLREFVGEAPWAHLDVAGTAYGEEPLPYQRKGGFGFPTRLLVAWVRSRTR
jgi:leucyl aminopeptidase